MKQVGRLACGLAIFAMVAASTSDVRARALIIYPLQGQLPDQQEADRSACADWAVAMSGGFITAPVPTPPIVVATPTGPVVTSGPPPAGMIGGIVNRNQAAALDALYANYLAAGATCLTARGYQVSM